MARTILSSRRHRFVLLELHCEHDPVWADWRPFSAVVGDGDGVEVGVLGPVVVAGAAAPFHRSAALELVVYLAFQRHGVRHGEWSLAIWPEHPVSLSTAHSTSSDARRALGRDSLGRPHLPRGVTLRLGDEVTTDVERFAALAEADDPHQLLRAMELVRGPIFAGLQRTDWAVFDGTQSDIEAVVVRTALRGADAFVELGRGDEAEWMVRQALLVSPYDERLYRALLVATAAQGNRVRLYSAMAQLRTLAGEAARPPARTAVELPADCLHPATTALYRDLLLRPPAAGGHPARL
jgi:DNA-binding SARP family transcriptional activator